MQAFARESLPTKLMRLPGPFHNLAALAYPEQAKNRVVPYNCGACTASNPYAEMLSLSNVSRAKASDLLRIHSFHYRPCLLLDVILSAGPVLRRKTELSEGSLHFRNRVTQFSTFSGRA